MRKNGSLGLSFRRPKFMTMLLSTCREDSDTNMPKEVKSHLSRSRKIKYGSRFIRLCYYRLYNI